MELRNACNAWEIVPKIKPKSRIRGDVGQARADHVV